MKVVFTEYAVNDLIRLRQFIAEKNPDAAKNAASRIKTAVLLVKEQPRIGKSVRDREDIRELGFSFGARGYVMRYHLLSEQIRILRIWHSREDRD